MNPQTISKSGYIMGLQCPKQLYYYKYVRHLADPVDDKLQKIFNFGHEVGERATEIFPGGQLIPHDDLTPAQQVEKTLTLLQQGVTTIFEAAIYAKGLFARVDILRREGIGWAIYEVKSSSKAKEVYRNDLALQCHLLRTAGFHINKTALVLLKNYRPFTQTFDPHQHLAIHDLTEDIFASLPTVKNNVEELHQMLTQPDPPIIEHGEHCQQPYKCRFYGDCHGSTQSVVDLATATVA